MLEVLQDPGWVPVAVRAKRTRVRFRHYERPFYLAHAGTQPRPWDVELPRGQIEAGAGTLHDPAKVIYVYHHGYAGSTLLVRLLDCPGTCLVYNEPNVHSGHYSVPVLRRLCYRTFRAGETPLIKLLPVDILQASQHFADHAEARAVCSCSCTSRGVLRVSRSPARLLARHVTAEQRFGGAPCTDPAEAAVRCWERITAEAITLGATHPLKTVESNKFSLDPTYTLEALWDWFGFPPRENWSDTLECVASRHSKNGRPFTFAIRLAQRDAYAEGAVMGLDDHGSELASAHDGSTRPIQLVSGGSVEGQRQLRLATPDGDREPARTELAVAKTDPFDLVGDATREDDEAVVERFERCARRPHLSPPTPLELVVEAQRTALETRRRLVEVIHGRKPARGRGAAAVVDVSTGSTVTGAVHAAAARWSAETEPGNPGSADVGERTCANADRRPQRRSLSRSCRCANAGPYGRGGSHSPSGPP